MDPIVRAIRRATGNMIRRLESNAAVPEMRFDPHEQGASILTMIAPANPWFATIDFRITYSGYGSQTPIINTKRWGEVIGHLLVILTDRQYLLSDHIDKITKNIRDKLTYPGLTIHSIDCRPWKYANPDLFSEHTIKHSTNFIHQIIRTQVEIEVIGDSLRPVIHKIAIHGNDHNDLRIAFQDRVREHARLYYMQRDGHRLTVEPIINRLLKRMNREDRNRLIQHLLQQPISNINQRKSDPNWTNAQLGQIGLTVPAVLESIRFKSGNIIGRVRINDQISWNNGRLSLHHMNLPDTMIHALTGEKLSRLIEHEMLDADAMITSIRVQENGRIRVHTDSRPDILDLTDIESHS